MYYIAIIVSLALYSMLTNILEGKGAASVDRAIRGYRIGQGWAITNGNNKALDVGRR